MAVAEHVPEGAHKGLRPNAVGIGGAVIMSAAIMGPAVSTFFNPQFSTPFSGAATPLVYLVTVGIMVLVASGIMEMAREFPSAGAFYTYVSRGLGAKAGFMTGGLMFVAYALLPPAEIGLIGAYLQGTFNDEFSTNIPWWIIGMVPAIAMVGLAYRGISASLKTALVLFAAEVTVILVLSLIILGKGGHTGTVSLHPFNPDASPNGFSGLTTGFVFAALSFVGFEAAATLGHEVKSPRRTVPRAILLSVLGVGLLYVFCIWIEVLGLGTSATNKLTGASLPWNDLAHTYASWMKWPVIVASVSSMFAVMVNSSNGIVRIINTMGQEQLLPKFLAEIHPRFRTPSKAVVAQGIFAVGLAIVVGLLAGGLGSSAAGASVYGYLGFLLTLAILPVYVLTNLAAINWFRAKGTFNPLKHALLPLLGGGLMVALLYGQIVNNPAPPFSWFPWVILGWTAFVVAVALYLGSTRPDEMKRAGELLATGEIAGETEHLVSDPGKAIV
jgi:amino acid transporter